MSTKFYFSSDSISYLVLPRTVRNASRLGILPRELVSHV